MNKTPKKTAINKLKQDKRFLILIYSLFVIIGGIWYSNYKEIKIFDIIRNDKTTVFKPFDYEIMSNEEIVLLVNINIATAEELMELDGIGETIAESIIKYRTENGYFKSIEEIKNVNKIGDKTFEKIKDYITI